MLAPQSSTVGRYIRNGASPRHRQPSVCGRTFGSIAFGNLFFRRANGFHSTFPPSNRSHRRTPDWCLPSRPRANPVFWTKWIWMYFMTNMLDSRGLETSNENIHVSNVIFFRPLQGTSITMTQCSTTPNSNPPNQPHVLKNPFMFWRTRSCSEEPVQPFIFWRTIHLLKNRSCSKELIQPSMFWRTRSTVHVLKNRFNPFMFWRTRSTVHVLKNPFNRSCSEEPVQPLMFWRTIHLLKNRSCSKELIQPFMFWRTGSTIHVLKNPFNRPCSEELIQLFMF